MFGRVRIPSVLKILILCAVGSWDCLGQQCWLNDPFAPIVKLELSLDRNELLLKLRNDSGKLVSLRQINLLLEGKKSPILLLQEPVDLPPADRYYLELGDLLEKCFDRSVERQLKVVKIRLSLEPELPAQPAECTYRLTVQNLRVTQCVRIGPEM